MTYRWEFEEVTHKTITKNRETELVGFIKKGSLKNSNSNSFQSICCQMLNLVFTFKKIKLEHN